MLARDGFDRREALLDPFLALRIGFEIRLVTLHRLDALAQRDQAFVDQLARSVRSAHRARDSERAMLSARETACSALTSSASRSSCMISRAPDASRPRCDRRWRSAVSSSIFAGLEIQRLAARSR